MKIISQIVPRLPPLIDGLGDYAISLALRLRKDRGIESRFIIADPAWKGNSQIEGFSVQKISSRSVDHFLSICSTYVQTQSAEIDPIIFLHYVNYGYAKRGCPFWLVNGLEQWKRGAKERRLVTMFHELYATGPFWKSAFWLSGIQKGLAGKIAEISDLVLSNRQRNADIIQSWKVPLKKGVFVMPVFSNIGEPVHIPYLKERKNRMVLFGNHRERIWNCPESREKLFKACEILGLDEIYDVGSRIKKKLTARNGLRIQQTGERDHRDISKIFLESRAGFLDYPRGNLAKSGVFAAYCSHGLLPVNGRRILDADGLKENRHYLVIEHQNKKPPLDKQQDIAKNAYDWYQTHTISKQANVFTSLVFP